MDIGPSLAQGEETTENAFNRKRFGYCFSWINAMRQKLISFSFLSWVDWINFRLIDR